MKIIIFATIILIFAKNMFAQISTFPIWFEDSKGNKDTLFFGYDRFATMEVDSALGEENLIGNQHNSDFFVFFTDASARNPGFEGKSDRIDTIVGRFVSKKQFVDQIYQPIEIGIITKNWPVTISWPRDELLGFIAKYWMSEYSKYYSFIMTSWHPVSGWFDVFNCGEWPDIPYTNMEQKSKIKVESKNFCKYFSTHLSDTVHLMYVAADQTSSRPIKKNGDFTIRYLSGNRTIIIENIKGAKIFNMQIVDVNGRLILEEEVECQPGSQISMVFDGRMQGPFLILLNDNLENSLLFIHKFIAK